MDVIVENLTKSFENQKARGFYFFSSKKRRNSWFSGAERCG